MCPEHILAGQDSQSLGGGECVHFWVDKNRIQYPGLDSNKELKLWIFLTASECIYCQFNTIARWENVKEFHFAPGESKGLFCDRMRVLLVGFH